MPHNANPSSMAVAIENFYKGKQQNTIVLGDMFELGEEEIKHKS
jgi:UDP-N-acetylmuramyl pentapeptide synthase